MFSPFIKDRKILRERRAFVNRLDYKADLWLNIPVSDQEGLGPVIGFRTPVTRSGG
jgi:hypothetical protein